MKAIRFGCLVFCVATLFIGCGKGAWITPTGPTDTPQHNYNTGMRALESGDYERAMASFERAKGLDPDYAPAYEGIGLVYLMQNQLEEAVWNFRESLKKDKYYAPAHVGLGRVYLAQSQYDRARRQFDAAMRRDRQNVDARYYKGVSYMAEQRFQDARKWFAQTLELDNGHVAANRDWAKIDKIQRAMPGTELGRQIAFKDAISRSDLSALFVEELKIDQVFQHVLRKTGGEMKSSPFTPMELIDIDGNWAEQYIRSLIKLGVMMPYPDRTFRPEEAVRRRDFAIAVQNLLTAIVEEKELRTTFVGSAAAFPDVPSSNFAYNAVLLVTTRGILSADVETGNFYPVDMISGADALIGLRQLMGLLP